MNISLALAAFFSGVGAVLVTIGWRLVSHNNALLEENRRLLGVAAERASWRHAPWRWWLKPVFASAVLLPSVGLTFSPLVSQAPEPPVLTDLPATIHTPAATLVREEKPAAPLEDAVAAAEALPRRDKARSGGCKPITLGEARDIAREVARREGMAEGLLLAIIFHESRFAPCAVSASGAQGLMQLKPETAWEVGVRNPFDPEDNIGGGARYLVKLLRRYDGDTSLALGAYLHGATVIDRHGRLPDIPATHQYVREIQDLAEILGGAPAD